MPWESGGGKEPDDLLVVAYTPALTPLSPPQTRPKRPGGALVLLAPSKAILGEISRSGYLVQGGSGGVTQPSAASSW